MGFWGSVAQTVGNIVGGGAGDVINKIGQGVDVAAQMIGHSGQTSAQNQQLKYAQDLEASKTQAEKDRIALAARATAQNGQEGAAGAAVAEQAAMDKARVAANQAAVRGALQKHIQDVSFNRGGLSSNVPTMSFSGGLRPSAFGPELAAAGDVLNKSGMNDLQNPPKFPEVKPTEEFKQSQPDAPTAPDETIWEKLAGPLGFGLTIAGEAMKGHPPQAPAPPTSGGNPQTGATLSPVDLLQILSKIPAPTPRQTDPTLGTGVTFGPGVLQAPTLGAGVTFGGG